LAPHRSCSSGQHPVWNRNTFFVAARLTPTAAPLMQHGATVAVDRAAIANKTSKNAAKWTKNAPK
jgi:hypothetical protein